MHRLGQVVVGAHLEPDDAIHFIHAARQDDDRHVAGRAQKTAPLESSSVDDVEHHEIDARAFERALHAGIAARRAHTKAVFFQRMDERRARFTVLIDDQQVALLGFHLRHHCHERREEFHHARDFER